MGSALGSNNTSSNATPAPVPAAVNGSSSDPNATPSPTPAPVSSNSSTNATEPSPAPAAGSTAISGACQPRTSLFLRIVLLLVLTWLGAANNNSSNASTNMTAAPTPTPTPAPANGNSSEPATSNSSNINQWYRQVRSSSRFVLCCHERLCCSVSALKEAPPSWLRGAVAFMPDKIHQVRQWLFGRVMDSCVNE